MITGWMAFSLFIALFLTFVFAIWFNDWLERYYQRKDQEERERMVQDSQCPAKIEPNK